MLRTLRVLNQLINSKWRQIIRSRGSDPLKLLKAHGNEADAMKKAIEDGKKEIVGLNKTSDNLKRSSNAGKKLNDTSSKLTYDRNVLALGLTKTTDIERIMLMNETQKYTELGRKINEAIKKASGDSVVASAAVTRSNAVKILQKTSEDCKNSSSEGNISKNKNKIQSDTKIQEFNDYKSQKSNVNISSDESKTRSVAVKNDIDIPVSKLLKQAVCKSSSIDTSSDMRKTQSVATSEVIDDCQRIQSDQTVANDVGKTQIDAIIPSHNQHFSDDISSDVGITNVDPLIQACNGYISGAIIKASYDDDSNNGETKYMDDDEKSSSNESKTDNSKKSVRSGGGGGGDEISVDLANAFKLYKLDEGPVSSTQFNKEQALRYYNQMQTMRRLENVASNLYKAKIVRGFCHLYSGQEACAVGIKAAMRDIDNVITAYRCHGWCYLCGGDPHGILSELTGRNTGLSRGKGGSMHMYTPTFYGGNGIVGAQVPLGTGIALASKYKGDGAICFNCYGDGAANQGQVFESFNIACLWKLPVIYVCENNQYGMGTKTNRSSCNTDYYTRGEYIPGIWVDGMNVLAVRTATEFAIKYALKNGPIVMELYTYRYMGHSMSDPGTSYRSRDEVDEVRTKSDPIMKFKDLCITYGVLTEEETKALDAKIKKDIDIVAEKAKTDKEIDLNEMTADIYANNLEEKIRSVRGYTLAHHKVQKKTFKPA